MPVFDVRTMDERLDTTLARPQFYSTAVAFFGGLGLLLAIIGVYGVTSYSVLQRTREMGIRLALGTTPGRLRATMLRQSSLTIGLGALAGLAMAVGFGRYLQSLVQGADSAIVATSIVAVLSPPLWPPPQPGPPRVTSRGSISGTCCGRNAPTETQVSPTAGTSSTTSEVNAVSYL